MHKVYILILKLQVGIKLTVWKGFITTYSCVFGNRGLTLDNKTVLWEGKGGGTNTDIRPKEGTQVICLVIILKYLGQRQ